MQKLNVADSKFLADHYNTTSQIIHKLMHLLSKMEGTPSLKSLPDSMLPTEELYNLCIGYAAMYDTLLEHQLIKSGSPKTPNTTH